MTPQRSRREIIDVLAVASVITAAFVGSVVVTPLYVLYQRKFGFSEITLTLIYAVYGVGNLGALLLFGQFSDRAGRKRATMPGLAAAAVGALFFLFAHGTAALYAGRLSIGLAVGILTGTGTAWLAEIFGPANRSSAAVTASTANLVGLAVGPLVGGFLAQYAPAPLVLPFLVYLLGLAIVAAAIVRTPETVEQQGIRGLGLWRVRPRVGVPRDRLRAFAAPAITGFVIFSLGGLYFALIPTIVLRDLQVKNLAVGGIVVSVLGTCAALCVRLARRLTPDTAMRSGLLCLLPAVALVFAAQAARSMTLLLLAAALAGITIALGYRGSLQVVNEIAPDDRRAEVVSSYLIVCFIGNAIPVIGVGVLSTLTNPSTASLVFACTVGVLAVAALAWHRRFKIVAKF